MMLLIFNNLVVGGYVHALRSSLVDPLISLERTSGRS